MKPAEKEFLPMQPGDVYQTYADVIGLEKDFDFRPSTPLSEVGLTAICRLVCGILQEIVGIKK
ncbi:MAG: hypothetical protein V8R94_03435 [Lachnospiraceae bacterium]